MRVVALLLLAGGCVGVTDEGSPWEPAELIGSAPTLRAAPGCTLRIASWNVHKVPDPDALISALLESKEISKADVILLQESSAYPTEDEPRTAMVADALQMTWAHQPVRDLDDGGVQGNGILSRYPLERVMVKSLPFIDQPYHSQPRGAIAADVVVGDKRVRVMSVHLDVRISISDRIRQLDPAASTLDEQAVVGGDFNTAPWQWIEGLVPLTGTGAVVDLNQAAALDSYMASRRYSSNVSPDTVTFPVPGFPMRLDNLYSRAVKITNSGVEHSDGSDHMPIYVDVDLCGS